MTAAELIEILKQYPPELLVEIATDYSCEPLIMVASIIKIAKTENSLVLYPEKHTYYSQEFKK